MRHKYYGKKLSRNHNERKMLLRNLCRDVIIHGKIITTLAKAQAVRPMVEHLITLAKKNTPASIMAVRKLFTDAKVVDMLRSDAKFRFAGRAGGYTRIYKLGRRPGDSAEEVIFSLVDDRITTTIPVDIKTKTHQTTAKKAKEIKSKTLTKTRTGNKPVKRQVRSKTKK